MTEWIYDDGGRAQAGYRGDAGDCVTRAVAIAGGIPYQEAYDLVNETGRTSTVRKGKTSAHIRVAPEDAWLTTKRLEQLTFRTGHGLWRTLQSLRRRELIAKDHDVRAWRITDKGREALG